MKTISKALVASVVALVPAGAALADPGLADVGAHQHFLKAPDGSLMPVGPNICDDPNLQNAFNQFHYNVHHSATAPNSPAPTLGPQHGAPGLHNEVGAELVVNRCD